MSSSAHRSACCGPGRLRLGPGRRCSSASARGGQTARAVRPRPRARDLPGRVGRGRDGGASRRTGRPAGDLPRRRALPPPPGDPRPLDLLLHGLALLTTDGHAAAAPTLQRAAKALASIPVEDVLRWGWMAAGAATVVWDLRGLYAISARQVQLVRDAGALAQLPMYLAQLGIARPWMGDFAGAASLIAETDERRGGDREPHRALYPADAPGPAGQGSRGHRADSERDRAGRGQGQGMAAI